MVQPINEFAIATGNQLSKSADSSSRLRDGREVGDDSFRELLDSRDSASVREEAESRSELNERDERTQHDETPRSESGSRAEDSVQQENTEQPAADRQSSDNADSETQTEGERSETQSEREPTGEDDVHSDFDKTEVVDVDQESALSSVEPDIAPIIEETLATSAAFGTKDTSALPSEVVATALPHSAEPNPGVFDAKSSGVNGGANLTLENAASSTVAASAVATTGQVATVTETRESVDVRTTSAGTQSGAVSSQDPTLNLAANSEAANLASASTTDAETVTDVSVTSQSVRESRTDLVGDSALGSLANGDDVAPSNLSELNALNASNSQAAGDETRALTGLDNALGNEISSLGDAPELLPQREQQAGAGVNAVSENASLGSGADFGQREQSSNFGQSAESGFAIAGSNTDGSQRVRGPQGFESVLRGLANTRGAVVNQAVSVVTQTVESLGDERVRVATVELQPLELGKLSIRVEQAGDVITATILASDVNTSELLESQKSNLEEALADLGYDQSSVDVSHGESSDGETNEQNGRSNPSMIVQAGESESSLPDSNQTLAGLNIIA